MSPPTRELALLLELLQPRGLELRRALLAREAVNQDLEQRRGHMEVRRPGD